MLEKGDVIYSIANITSWFSGFWPWNFKLASGFKRLLAWPEFHKLLQGGNLWFLSLHFFSTLFFSTDYANKSHQLMFKVSVIRYRYQTGYRIHSLNQRPGLIIKVSKCFQFYTHVYLTHCSKEYGMAFKKTFICLFQSFFVHRYARIYHWTLSFFTNQWPGFCPGKTHITLIKAWLDWMHMWHKLDYAFVFVNMIFNPRQL